jgi:hypothetical protein
MKNNIKKKKITIDKYSKIINKVLEQKKPVHELLIEAIQKSSNYEIIN